MGVLERLEPQCVFALFEELSAIPHGSSHTKEISDYCVEFARSRGLKCRQDAAYNVVIWKEGTPGYEQSEPVILQGHLDMVCEKTPECAKDMAREGLDLFVDGDLIGAKGTTLGADDGIAIAMALAILDAKDLAHPPLEAVFTVDEEIGMLGAEALDTSDLKGRKLLNLDSEDEGVLTVSCAGGNMTVCELPITREPFPGKTLAVTVDGAIGGHSGQEIHQGRGNAVLLLGRVLSAMERQGALRLIRVDGGLKDNAIPRKATAVVSAADEAAMARVAKQMNGVLQNEYRTTDPNVRVSLMPTEDALAPMDAAGTQNVICLMTCAPNGVQVMSADIKGLVQTSLNLGILTTEDSALRATFCVRSSVASQKEMLVEQLRRLMERLGGCVTVLSDYPAWEYRKDSPLRELVAQVYTQQTGKEPKIEAIHAGVECGLFCGKLPGLDCVSYGPDLTEIHTPRERMHIASVGRIWDLTVEVLRRCR